MLILSVLVPALSRVSALIKIKSLRNSSFFTNTGLTFDVKMKKTEGGKKTQEFKRSFSMNHLVILSLLQGNLGILLFS